MLYALIVSIVIIFVLFLVFEKSSIPEGYEDEEGFHFGKKEK